MSAGALSGASDPQLAEDYEIDVVRRLVILRGLPPASFEEWKAGLTQAFSDPRYQLGFNLLSHRLPGVAPSSATVEAGAVYLNSLLPTLPCTRWAVVTTDQLQFDMVRILGGLAAPSRIAIQAFDDYGEALLWLERPAFGEP